MYDIPSVDDIVGSVSSASGSLEQPDAPVSPIYSDADYQPKLSNWYTARPYGFKFTAKDGTEMVMYLPISPSNLTINTTFATNLVSTIYGVVEEHSPVRYFDITIDGNTGMGPKYVHPFRGGDTMLPGAGRSRFTVQQAIDPGALGGFFAKTLTKADNIWSETSNLLNLTPDAPTGLQLDQTGYMAFHNLYRFLLKYKKDASGNDNTPGNRSGNTHPLIFFNYKDNNQYRVSVRSFVMKRDANDPMLYHYSISLRGYTLEDAGRKDLGGDTAEKTQERLSALGLDGVSGSTLLGDIMKKADQAKGILASVGSGINSLGM